MCLKIPCDRKSEKFYKIFWELNRASVDNRGKCFWTEDGRVQSFRLQRYSDGALHSHSHVLFSRLDVMLMIRWPGDAWVLTATKLRAFAGPFKWAPALQDMQSRWLRLSCGLWRSKAHIHGFCCSCCAAMKPADEWSVNAGLVRRSLKNLEQQYFICIW
jgi:hypothetical protein